MIIRWKYVAVMSFGLALVVSVLAYLQLEPYESYIASPTITAEPDVIVRTKTPPPLPSLNAPLQPEDVPIVAMPLGGARPIPDPSPPRRSMYPKCFMIEWGDGPAIDGSYVFVIHPTQIFLRSMHENPNPNSVYWVAPLSSSQYSHIVAFLDHYNGQVFRRSKAVYPGYQFLELNAPRGTPWLPKGKNTKRQLADWHQEMRAVANFNLNRILHELNLAMPSSDQNLPSRAEVDEAHVVQIDEHVSL